MHAVAIKLLLQLGEYETETREWLKLPEDHKTWTEWKTTIWEAYVAKRRAEAARGEGSKILWWFRHIRCGSRKDIKLTTTESRK